MVKPYHINLSYHVINFEEDPQSINGMDDSEPNCVSTQAKESQMRHKLCALLYPLTWDFREDNIAVFSPTLS